LAASPNFLDHKFGNPERRTRPCFHTFAAAISLIAVRGGADTPERPHQRHFKVVFHLTAKVLLRHGDFFAQQKGNNEKKTKTRN
jgi:hypothetical protein